MKTYKEFTKQEVFRNWRFWKIVYHILGKILNIFLLKNNKYETHRDTHKRFQFDASPMDDAILMWKEPILEPPFSFLKYVVY